MPTGGVKSDSELYIMCTALCLPSQLSEGYRPQHGRPLSAGLRWAATWAAWCAHAWVGRAPEMAGATRGRPGGSRRAVQYARTALAAAGVPVGLACALALAIALSFNTQKNGLSWVWSGWGCSYRSGHGLCAYGQGNAPSWRAPAGRARAYQHMVSSVWVIGGTAKTCRGQRRRASGTGAKATRTGFCACASCGGGGGGGPPPARPTRWRNMARDGARFRFAGGETKIGGFSCCCANGSWWWPRTS